MNRFFTDERTGERFVISADEDCKYIQKVLRLKIGDLVEICDFNSEFICEIIGMDRDVTCRIVEEKGTVRESDVSITLFQGLPKLDKMDWIIQKTTELGVNRIVPVNTRRSIMKVKKDSKIERWNKVALSAAQQSKRIKVPVVEEPVGIEDLMAHYGDSLDALLVPYEGQEDLNLKHVLSELNGLKRLGLLIGPEGGLDLSDLTAVDSPKTHQVSLGNRILRTETAAIISVGIVQYEIGDLGE